MHETSALTARVQIHQRGRQLNRCLRVTNRNNCFPSARFTRWARRLKDLHSRPNGESKPLGVHFKQFQFVLNAFVFGWHGSD